MSSSSGWSRTDWQIVLAIFIIGILSTFPILNALEFLRHTEADRTLIGWEMLQRRDFVVPYLLGDPYPTKPPLFYIALSAVFALVGSPTEFSARSISAIAATAMLLTQYVGIRCLQGSRSLAILSTLILFSAGPFAISAIVAEIDMSFAAAVNLALWCAIAAAIRPNVTFIFALWLSTTIAFFIKGPQVFIVIGSILGMAWLLRARGAITPEGLHPLRKEFRYHAIGFLLFGACLAGWIFLLTQRIPGAHLEALLNREVLARVLSDASASLRQRGGVFYVEYLLLHFLPASLGLLGFLHRRRTSNVAAMRGPLTLCGTAVLVSLVILSFASGKAGRYMLPLSGAYSFVLAHGWQTLDASVGFGRLRNATSFICFGCSAALVVGILFLFVKLTAPAALSLLPLALILFLLGRSLRRGTGSRGILLLTVLSLLLLRIPFATVYAPLRNSALSVRPVANAIVSLTTSDEPLFVIEMVERWLPYSIIRQGRVVLRLTPQLVKERASVFGTSAVLLSQDERWQLDALQQAGISPVLLGEWAVGKNQYILIKLPNTALTVFHPAPLYPDSVRTGP